jgi:RND family efflux transporter MFP subunit
MRQLAFISVSILAFALAGCNASREVKREAPSRPVLVAQIHYAPRVAAAVLPAVVKPHIEADLGFRIGGKIKQRLVDRGAVVKAGDTLATLDTTDLLLQLEQAEAERASARATFDQAAAEAARVSTLHKQGWSAASDFDRAKSVGDQAQAALDRAERAVLLSKDALDYATLKTDVDGSVSAVNAEPGQVVAAGAPVLRVAQLDGVEVDVAVPETLLSRARADDATVEFWALPGLKIRARLRELSSMADPATRTYDARYTLDAAPKAVALGMSATLSLSPAGQRVAAAPLAAVLDEGNGPAVWVVKPDTGVASLRSVILVGADSARAFIASGVNEGDEVVALGAQKIVPGETLHIVEDLAGL